MSKAQKARASLPKSSIASEKVDTTPGHKWNEVEKNGEHLILIKVSHIVTNLYSTQSRGHAKSKDLFRYRPGEFSYSESTDA
jgi:hypothetical protein